MIYKHRNGSSQEAERFRLAMAIVQADYDLSPEVQREAKAIAKRLETHTISRQKGVKATRS